MFIAEEFNKYFVSVFNVEDTQNVPQPSVNTSGRTTNFLSDVTFTEDDVKSKLMKIRADKAPRADDISPRLLCNLTDEIFKPLWLLFRKSLDEGFVPEDWKKANLWFPGVEILRRRGESMITAMILVAVVGGYVLTSFILLKYPTLLHKKKKIHFSAVHISHRGGAGENLENTLTAFKHAADVGTQMLELDCHITQDGQVVVCHDENLLRLTGQPVMVQDLPYKELPPLLSNLRLEFPPGYAVTGTDRHIPLLREVYQQFPTMPINVDVKTNSDELIKKGEVSDLTAEFGREHITVWGSRSSRVVRKCFKENPSIPILFSMSRVLQLLLFYYTGLLPFIPLKESFYEVVMPSIIFKSGRELKPSTRFLFKISDFLLMSPGMFKHLSARGIQVYLWVLNENEDFERAFSYGVDGVMTDFPTKLQEYLQRR